MKDFMKSKWLLLGTLVSPLPFLSSVAAAQKAPQKPHVILIMTDQQRGDAMGCMGNEQIITPNMDALAADGYLFTNGYTSAPSSTPARAGLLTGQSPWHHGLLGYGKVASHYKYEMPQMLRDCGYYTMGVGKMHWHPQRATHGFHTTIIDESGRVEDENFMSDYRQWFQMMAPGMNPDKTGVKWNEHGAKTYQLPEELHPTVWTANTAIEVINNYKNDDQPIYLKISFARPHSPYDPPVRCLEKYDNIEMDGPAKGEWSQHVGENLKDPSKDLDAAFGQFGDDYVKNSKKHYYASITFVDEQVGKIVEALKKNGMYDNAIVCFTADHGDMMGDHNHWRKTYAYEGSSKIPFIVKLPKNMPVNLKSGSEVEAPVELRDFLPTFLDIAEAEIPAELDGRSVLPLMQEKDPEWRRWIDIEHAASYTRNNYWCALTDGKVKYIWFFLTGEEQLFDLQKDPKESVNLISSKKYKKVAHELRTAMAEHLSERGEEWVKDGKLVVRKGVMLYSPNYPEEHPKVKKYQK